MVKFDVPDVTGVPLMTPAGLSVNPAGKLPLSMFQVIGAVPTATIDWLYALSAVPFCKLVVVIDGATTVCVFP